jgi:hypothetical protein
MRDLNLAACARQRLAGPNSVANVRLSGMPHDTHRQDRRIL